MYCERNCHYKSLSECRLRFEYEAGGILKISYMLSLALECSQCKQAYIEYASQSQWIELQSLPKQKRIVIAR
jgi:hypothetical protein